MNEINKKEEEQGDKSRGLPLLLKLSGEWTYTGKGIWIRKKKKVEKNEDK